jgi:hypothetical protein
MDGTVHRVEGSEARSEQGSGEAKAQGSSGRESGRASWGDEGFEADEAGDVATWSWRTGSGASGSSRRGDTSRGKRRSLLRRGAGHHVSREAWASVKPGVTGPGRTDHDLTPGDPTAREQAGPERALATPTRSKASEGRNPRDGCGTKQGREVRVGHETAEGLRKPESGTAAEVDGPPRTGLTRMMPSRGGEPRGSRHPIREDRTAGRT